jgi:proteasome lid subunit RPN8/RPN11
MCDFAAEQHPHEIILLLRGKVGRDAIAIDDFLLPPMAVSGARFAEFPLHVLPIDFSIVGTAHSHPSGVLSPSVGDLNNFYSRVMMIMANPYMIANVAAFNAKGERISIRVSH